MIRLLFISLLLLSISKINAQTDNLKFDKALADSLKADEYGMKKYVLVILKTGKIKPVTKQIGDSLFIGHFKNIERLANNGKLVAAGPLSKNKNRYEGIFILNVEKVEEAALILETDPAIKAKLLDTELYSLYGSAALPLYLKFHENVKKKDF